MKVEVYYSGKLNKIYLVILKGIRILQVMDAEYIIEWTHSFEREFNRMTYLGEL